MLGRGAAAVVAALGCGVLGSGCAKPVPSRWAGPAPAGLSAQTESAAVFPPDTSVVVADVSAAEFSRSDAALAGVPAGARQADFWPAGPAPSLDARTTLYLGRSNETFVFFRERRRYDDPRRVYR